jgi:hypothetical protein
MNSTSGVTSPLCSRRSFICACLVGLTAAQGCALFRRSKSIDASIYKPAVAKTTSQATEQLSQLSVVNGGKKPTVCFVGVIGDSASEISLATRAELEKSDKFKLVDKTAMQNALKVADLKATEIFIPTKRAKFTDALGEPFDYILAGYVENIEEPVDPNDEDSKKIAKTIYRLSLFNLDTNRTSDFIADL